MRNNDQKLDQLKNDLDKKNLINMLISKNLKGGKNCPPPWGGERS